MARGKFGWVLVSHLLCQEYLMPAMVFLLRVTALNLILT